MILFGAIADRWLAASRRVTESVTPTIPDAPSAGSVLARHRAAAERALIMDNVHAMRATDKVRVL